MDSKKLALRCRELADNRKAENIVILDLRKHAGITDFMVLCSGTSEPHLRAIEEEVAEKLRDQDGIRPRAIDGARHSGWIILDYVDVLVHVMKADVRDHYDLEGLWNDAPRLRTPRARKPAPAAGGTATATPRKRAAKAKTTAKPDLKAGGAADDEGEGD